MRIIPPAVALAAVLATASSVSGSSIGQGRTASHVVNPRSMALVTDARSALAAGRLESANDAGETALTIDPDNRAAFTTLAEVALRQSLPGKAIRLYREALAIEPNDVSALAGQGEAMVAKGAVTKARENLTRVRTLCGGGACPDAVRLSAAIDRGPPPAVVSAQAIVPVKDKP